MFKKWLAFLALPLLLLLPGCVHVENTISINNDFGGSWVALIAPSPELGLSQEDVEKKLDKVALHGYSLKETTTKIQTKENEERTIEAYEITLPFASSEELKTLTEKLNQAFGRKAPEQVMLPDGKAQDIYEVNLGSSFDRMRVTVPGTIVPDSIGSGTLLSSDTVEYTKDAPVHFRFKKKSSVPFLWIGLVIVGIAGAFLYYKKRRT